MTGGRDSTPYWRDEGYWALGEDDDVEPKRRRERKKPMKKQLPETGQLHRCMCEWLYPPRPFDHLDFCPNKEKKEDNG